MPIVKRVSLHMSSDDLGTRLPVLLESLFAQTVSDWQAVIVDNSGNRPTPSEPPIYVLRNPRPQSLARSMSQAIELATGSEFFILCKSDLIFAPDTLQKMLDAFEKDASLVYAWPSLAKASFDPDSTEGELLFSKDRVQLRREEDLSASCVMIRSQDLGALRPDARYSNDLVMQDFVWKLAQTGAKGRHLEDAVIWLQPGATLASPRFLRYWTWVWTRRASRS